MFGDSFFTGNGGFIMDKDVRLVFVPMFGDSFFTAAMVNAKK